MTVIAYVQPTASTSRKLGKYQDYSRAVGSVVTRMQRDNAEEHKRLTPRAIRKILKDNALLAHPEMALPAIENLVDELLPHAMREYAGPPALVAPKPVVNDARRAERLRQKQAMKSRRR